MNLKDVSLSKKDGTEKPLGVPKWVLDVPVAEYHKARNKFLTSHGLSDFRACPKLFKLKMNGLIEEEDRAAWILGRAVHTFALEGAKIFDQRYAVGGPINDRTGAPFGRTSKTWQEWADAQKPKECLDNDQADEVGKLSKAINTHPLVPTLLDGALIEKTIRGEINGVPCQVRPDALQLGETPCIIDLKTCDDLTWFEADARRFGYAYQSAFYRSVVRSAGGVHASCVLVAVEKKEPRRVGVWKLGQACLEEAEQKNLQAINELKKCGEKNEWPTGYESIRDFEYL